MSDDDRHPLTTSFLYTPIRKINSRRMRMRFSSCCLLLAILVGPALRLTRAEDKMVHAASATSKFVNFPGLPTCMKGSVQNGDPSKGASVILSKSATGCTVPWHWHSAS